MVENYTAPGFKSDAFHCPYCGVYSHQKWSCLTRKGLGIGSQFGSGIPTCSSNQNLAGNKYKSVRDIDISTCERCKKYSVWLDGEMLYPSSNGPLPIEDMPEDVKADFLEARQIVNASPRAAAALLRLALQKMMVHLGEKGKDINEDIGNLVKKGLSEKIQQALDIVRVIGNQAVHPGELNIKDDIETALTLFDLLNLIVEDMITRTKKLQEMYDKLPESKKEGIRNRDNKN